MRYEFYQHPDGTVRHAAWYIDMTADDPFCPYPYDEFRAADYCYGTNAFGEGIFRYYNNGRVQRITETCQFSVYGLKKSNARAKIRKYFQ